jgi:ferredoxin
VSFDKLGDLMPENASEAMPETRLNRIRECIQTLKQAEALVLDQSVRIIVGKRLSVDPDFNWDELLQDEAYRIAPDNESCLAASESFSLEMEALSKLMAAARIAKLELQSQFDEEIHTHYFEEFSWDHFSEAELGLCPPVLLIEEAEMLLGKELSAFSALLASNKPVKILALNKGESLPFHLENTSGTEAPSPMEEPGVFAISHRNAFTHQCAAHNPLHLIKGFEAGLEAPSAALFHVLAPADEASGNSFLKVAASVEGRQFPLFTYDNTKGKKWGSRFSIKDNPQAGKDWPEYTLEVETAEKEVQALSLAHTAADFFALNTALNARLLSVPPAFWTEDLIPLTEYLELPTDNLYGKVPFVWQVDTEGLLHKMALSYAWVEACKERLDFWNFIQELGGVNNFHVERAVEQTRTDLLAEKEREIAELKAASEKEIEAVRSSAVGEAMNSLAGVLLDLDPLAVKSAPSKSEKTPESKKKEAAADPIKKEAPAKVEEEDILISEEAWVESYKCTSCNECVNKYPEAFRYDGEKLAYLNDAGAISFRKLVDAAENCPAKCIHPGQPLDPKEAGLEELLERAKPFN